MKIQSLSIVVPAGCFNDCKFCVSKLHPFLAKNLVEKEFEFKDLHTLDYKDCMEFARDNGCNTLMFTGDGEPLMNMTFMDYVSTINQSLDKPFRWIELQTAGYKLGEIESNRNRYLRWLRNTIRVKVISLSLSDIFSSDNNAFMNGTPEKLKVDIDTVCSEIKRYGFTLRLSLNMTNIYDGVLPEQIFERADRLGADQITFRKLYLMENSLSDGAKAINNWIAYNSCSLSRLAGISEYIKENGKRLERLPFGAWKYSVNHMSTVLDDDCMSESNDKEELKYLILRQNCKLYTKWDDFGSILF